MSVEQAERLVRYPATFEEWWALPEHPRAEYVDGIVIVSPAARLTHQHVIARLTALWTHALPGLVALPEAGLQTGTDRYRKPDVIAIRPDQITERAWRAATAVLVAEVISRSTKSEDLMRKPQEYLDAGAEQYWVVDPEVRTLTVYGNVAGAWVVLHDLAPHHSTAEVAVGEFGTVAVDLDVVLGLSGSAPTVD